MSVRAEDQDFLQFRDAGSPEALARVFDATAPRLLVLAAHLARDAAQAEDLVQTTFLHAMRDAALYDGSAPVVAWLAGILRHRALDLRRRAAVRSAVPLDEATPARDVPDPVQLAADEELFARMAAAVDGLGEPYRQVLVLRLVHGLEPRSIAHALQRPPGTVRMQLKRGLEHLRRAMPEASTLFGALLVDAPRGLGAAREAVLREAGCALKPAAASSSLPAWIGGLLTMKTAVLCAGAAVLAAGLFALSRRPAASAEGARRAAPAPSAVLRPTGSERSGSAEPARSAVLAEAEPAGAASEGLAPAASVHGELAVRVLHDTDGSPAAGAGVYARPLGGGLGRALRTDDLGLARFAELALGEWQVHLDRRLEPVRVDVRASTTLEIRIPAGLDVAGRVIDLERRPVPFASVSRFNPAHEDLLQESVRADGEGRFRLRDVEFGTFIAARAEGWQPSELALAQPGREGAELELVLGARGQLLRGRVVAEDGEPAPHATVAIAVDEDARESLAGSGRAPSEVSRRKPMDLETLIVRADASGAFESSEVPSGHALVLAQPLDASAAGWSSAWIGADAPSEVLVVLRPGAVVRGRVLDGDGLPLVGAAVVAGWDGNAELGSLEDSVGSELSARRALTDERGEYELAGLFPGEHDLAVRVGRTELARESAELAAGESQTWSPVVEGSARLGVRLLGPDGEALADWVVDASAQPGKPGRAFHVSILESRTDARGVAWIEGLAAGVEHEIALYAPEGNGYRSLPSAQRGGALAGEPEPIVIQLAHGELPSAALAGRISGLAPSAGWSAAALRLARSGWEGGFSVRLDEQGEFAIGSLQPGVYALELWVSGAEAPAPLGTWTLQAGEALDVGNLRRP